MDVSIYPVDEGYGGSSVSRRVMSWLAPVSIVKVRCWAFRSRLVLGEIAEVLIWENVLKLSCPPLKDQVIGEFEAWSSRLLQYGLKVSWIPLKQEFGHLWPCEDGAWYFGQPLPINPLDEGQQVVKSGILFYFHRRIFQFPFGSPFPLRNFE